MPSKYNYPAWQKKFYSSGAWKRFRANYRQKVGGLCEICESKGIYKPGEIVHHKIELTAENVNDPDIALNEENVIFICQDCHNKIHFSRKRYVIDENGEVQTKGK